MVEKTFRIAITGATTPKGKALKEALPRSRFRDADVRLLDEEDLEGTLTEYDGGVEFIRQMRIDSFENVDLIFLCDDAEKTAMHLQLIREQLESAPTVVDLSGDHSLSDHPDRSSHSLPRDLELIESPVFLPHSLALGIAQVLDLCMAFGNISRACATALVPVSEYGKAGIEALHDQMVEIMNFSETPKDIFGQQLIFNILPAIGAIESTGNTDMEDNILSQVRSLLNRKNLPLQLLMNQAPVFYSYTVSLLLSFDNPVESERIHLAFENAEGFAVGENGSNIGPLEATDSNDYRLARLAGIPGDPHSVAMWFTFDNITTGSVNEAIAVAEDLFENDPRLAAS